MADYYGLLQGRLARTDAILGQVLAWLNDERPGTATLDGHGDYVDAWRHGGTAALLAYHHGYDNVKRWGDALEDYFPDNEQEFKQDVRNNEVGAKIGALARITGMTIPELGDALKAAFKAGAFQPDAYAPFSGGQTFQVGNMKVAIGSGVVSLPDGSRFDLTKSTVIPVDGVEYPVLHVIRKDGSVQNMWTNMDDSRTLFQGGVGKWELSKDGNASSASFTDRVSPAIPLEAPDGPSPAFAQAQEAERLVSEQNLANPAGLSAAELNRFYDATGHPAADQRASIVNGTLRVAPAGDAAKGPATTGFPRLNTEAPPYLDATRAAQGLFGQVQPSDVPYFPSQTIPGHTPNFADPQRAPTLPVPQGGKRSEGLDGSSPAFAQTSLTMPAFRPEGVYSAAGNFFAALRWEDRCGRTIASIGRVIRTRLRSRRGRRRDAAAISAPESRQSIAPFTC